LRPETVVVPQGRERAGQDVLDAGKPSYGYRTCVVDQAGHGELQFPHKHFNLASGSHLEPMGAPHPEKGGNHSVDQMVGHAYGIGLYGYYRKAGSPFDIGGEFLGHAPYRLVKVDRLRMGRPRPECHCHRHDAHHGQNHLHRYPPVLPLLPAGWHGP